MKNNQDYNVLKLQAEEYEKKKDYKNAIKFYQDLLSVINSILLSTGDHAEDTLSLYKLSIENKIKQCKNISIDVDELIIDIDNIDLNKNEQESLKTEKFINDGNDSDSDSSIDIENIKDDSHKNKENDLNKKNNLEDKKIERKLFEDRHDIVNDKFYNDVDDSSDEDEFKELSGRFKKEKISN